jgi:hypothetical protein
MKKHWILLLMLPAALTAQAQFKKLKELAGIPSIFKVGETVRVTGEIDGVHYKKGECWAFGKVAEVNVSQTGVYTYKIKLDHNPDGIRSHGPDVEIERGPVKQLSTLLLVQTYEKSLEKLKGYVVAKNDVYYDSWFPMVQADIDNMKNLLNESMAPGIVKYVENAQKELDGLKQQAGWKPKGKPSF